MWHVILMEAEDGYTRVVKVSTKNGFHKLNQTYSFMFIMANFGPAIHMLQQNSRLIRPGNGFQLKEPI